jgi:phosphoglucosamine mutase
VVATIMSNKALETALQKHGIGFRRTPVGDRSVLQGLDDSEFRLGGEQSGHIIVSEYSPTGDGLLAAVRTLAAVIASGKTLADWYDDLPLVPQTLLSLPFDNKGALDRPDIQAFIHDQELALGETGRLNIRASGTEPKIRIMVEAPDSAERARSIADQLITLTGESES